MQRLIIKVFIEKKVLRSKIIRKVDWLHVIILNWGQKVTF